MALFTRTDCTPFAYTGTQTAWFVDGTGDTKLNQAGADLTRLTYAAQGDLFFVICSDGVLTAHALQFLHAIAILLPLPGDEGLMLLDGSLHVLKGTGCKS